MTESGRPVFLIDGSRTPFLKGRGVPGPFAAADLAFLAGRPLLMRLPFAASAFDEVIVGCTAAGPDEANIARVVALRLGCGQQVPAWTVQRNCGSGLQAITAAHAAIAGGRADLVLAGGTEAMTHAPVLFTRALVRALGEWTRARSAAGRLGVLARLRPAHFKPVIGLLRGLTDPIVGLSMGQTAEIIAHRFGVSRESMDDYAARSHQRLTRAQAGGQLTEIETIYDWRGNYYDRDDGVRPDSTPAALARLKPVFDRPIGKVTAGNSAQVTDGAAWVVLASAEAVRRYQVPVLARVVDWQWAGLDPAQMGLGPVHAVTPLLGRHGLTVAAIDAWEINEAFAAQVLACLAAWRDAVFCREQLGLEGAAGEIDPERLNVDGGGISLGHPVGASWARIVLHLAHVLARRQGRHGVASLCIGGGQGGALLLARE